MPSKRTEITEISTGLGLLGFRDVGQALRARPPQLLNVTSSNWDGLDVAYSQGDFASEFESAFSNGAEFLAAPDGLRNRVPLRIEWKGPHPTPGYDQFPADLRVDHVYLISCKYASRILFNPSPSHLFERVLAVRSGGRRVDWFSKAAPEEYQVLYHAVTTALGIPGLPAAVVDLDKPSRAVLKPHLRNGWPPGVEPLYRSFAHRIAAESARVWASNLTTALAREEMLWRLLRFFGAPYFILGTSRSKNMRVRVYTPWDWRQEFELRNFDIAGDRHAGQPIVRWQAEVLERATGQTMVVPGHVEVRWSHGRFQKNPEAKVYLDMPHVDVPGYVAL